MRVQETGHSKPAASQRLLQLDILRGIAIILVLFRHPVVYDFNERVGWWRPISHRLCFFFGWTGVDLFFVLSGFLIGGLLFQEIRKTGSLDVRRFLIRRGFKIWPPYFALIAVAFVSLFVAARRIAVHDTARAAYLAFLGIAPNLLHLQNYLGTPRLFTWSLSVEEHFYLALPVFLLAVLRFARRSPKAILAIPIAAIAVIVACTTFRTVHNWNRPFQFLDHHAYTHLRIDGLFFGVLLAYVHRYHASTMARIGSHRIVLLVVGLALLGPTYCIFPERHRYSWTIGFTMLYLGYGAILVAMVYTTPGRGISGWLLTRWPCRAIAWVGFFSYSIYLWQQDLAQTPIRTYLIPWLIRLPSPIYWPIVETVHLIFAIGAGAIMAKLIEIPSIALRDRLFPARTRKIDLHPVALAAAEPVTAMGT